MAFDVYVWDSGIAKQYTSKGAVPLDMPRDTFTAIVQHLVHQKICRGEVQAKYIQEQLSVNTFFLLVWDQGWKGFLMGHSLGNGNGQYVDVLCTKKGYGTALMEFFTEYSWKKGADYIELNSLLKVLPFYRRHGFEHRPSCNAKEDVVMSDALANHLRNQQYTHVSEYMEDPRMQEHIMCLHRHGYTAKPSAECRDPTIGLAAFQKYGCVEDGFRMRKCRTRKHSKKSTSDTRHPVSRGVGL